MEQNPQAFSWDKIDPELLQQAVSLTDQELSAQGTAPVEGQPGVAPSGDDKAALQQKRDMSLMPDFMDDLQTSIGGGMAKAVFETKDFLFGEPEEGDKSAIRKNIEGMDRALDSESAGWGMTSGISQMVTGLIGAGKLLAPVKATQKFKAAGKVAEAGFEVARGALAGATVIDPHEERLSNLIEEFPDLQNPVTEYLAAQPDDSAAEGRFKNALESIGADLALIGAVKVVKFLKSGQVELAQREASKLEKAQAANRAEFGTDFGPAAKPEDPNVIANAGPTQANKDAFGMDFPIEETPNAARPGEVPPAPGSAAVASVPEGTPEAAPGVAPGPGTKEVFKEQVGTRTPYGPDGQPLIPDAPAARQAITVQEVDDETLNAVLKDGQADAAAIKKFGSREDAAASGYKFSQKTRLPWQKLRTTDSSLALVERATVALKGRYDAMKGGAVLKDQRVKDLVNDLAETYQEDPALILGQLAEAGENASQMVAQMEAALRIGNRMMNDVDELAAKIRNGNLEEYGGNLALAQEDLKSRFIVAMDTLGSGRSILSNSGRALRRAKGQFKFSKADLEKVRLMDPDKLAVIMQKAGGDPRKLASVMNETWATRVMSEATWHLTNGLLWMWPTHLVNMTTNAFMLAARPTEKFFGSQALKLLTKDPARRAELSSVSRQALREYTYTITSLADGWANAVEAFKRGDSILNPSNTEFFDGRMTGITTEPLPWKPVQSVTDLAQNAWMSANYRNLVGLPTRALGAADEFFKTMRYRAVVQSRAALQAADAGLSGDAAKQYVQKALDRAIDPNNGRALDANAIREAQMVSFQQDLNYDTTFGGSIGRGIQNARKTAPILAVVLPFVKTPVNVIRYGIKLTPGLNIAQKEFRDALIGKAGAEAQAHATGQMAMGSMFAALAAHMAATGRLTGGGPDDYKLQQELVATGWKPYSITWQDTEGNTQYFQLGRFDPVGMAMGMVSDIVALQQKNPDKDYSDLIGSAVISVAKNIGNKTFLLNLDSFMQAALDPENRLPKWAGRTAGSMVPFSSLLRGGNPDPYLREARGFVDSAMRGIPGASQTLPVSMDVFGDPIERYVGVVDEQAGGDIVEAEHNRIMLQTDKGLGKPDPKFEGVDLRDLAVKDGKNAYQRLQELSGHLPSGPSLKDRLEKVIRSDEYQDSPDGEAGVKGTRLNRLGRVVQQYREDAKKAFIRENPELKALIKSRQRDARGAYLENRKAREQGAPGARDLLEALSPQ